MPLNQNTNHAFCIRAIEAGDDAAVAGIIQQVMPEFGASGPGFALHDAEVLQMSEAYSESKRQQYFVVELANTVQGGAGFAPLPGESEDWCELRKMYFLPALRGLGAGQALIEHCLQAAKAAGFRWMYLETLNSMVVARKLYERNGFQLIDGPRGNTGHFSCNSFYLREL